MSDRVAYAAGNTIHRDHVNFPTILRSQIDSVVGVMTDIEKDRLWPVDITLAQAMAICWRVKTWRLNGFLTVSKTIDTGSPPILTGDSDANLREIQIGWTHGDFDLVATRERDLVSQLFYNSSYKALVSNGVKNRADNAPISDWTTTANFGVGAWSGATPGSGAAPPALTFGFLFGFWLYDPDTQKFSPPFTTSSFGSLVPFEFSGTPIVAGAGFTRSPQTVLSGIAPLGLSVPATMTITPGIAPAFNVPMEIGWRFTGEGPGEPVTGSGSGGFTLEAVEYWSYDGTYDTSSGAQLLDPFRA